MSEDARKDCRTQGKYSERNQYYEDKRTQKRQDKRQKGSPTAKDVQEKNFYKRRSDGGRSSNTSLVSESESSIKYEENSVHTFSELKDVKKPIEIKKPGRHTLSNTENGESVVFYEPQFLEENEALHLKKVLHDTTNWNDKKIVIHGVEVPQPRLVAWYGPFPYSYSGATLEPKEMPSTVVEIKKKVEDYLSQNGINVTLNSVLLNLYRTNKDSVAWHSDDELSMGVSPTIASVSLGVTRKFEMRYKYMQTRDENLHPKDEECFIHLANGSLLIMDGCMQKDWQHRVPKEYHDRGVRINLTFRTVYKLEDVPSSLGAYPQSCSKVVKKYNGSKADYGVSYDDDDFPPLSNSSPVCSNARKSRESGASMGVKSSELNGSHKGRSNGTSRSKTSLKNNSEISESNDFTNAERFSSNKTCLKTDKIHSSDKISADEVSHNKFSSKVCDKIVSGNDYYTKPFDNKTSLKTDAQTCESEDFWDCESSPCNNREDEIISRPENEVIEPSCNEQSTILNNLNEDKNNVKIDMENKNLCAYDSDFSSSNTDVAMRNKNFHTKDSYNVSASSVNSMQENVHAYKVNETPHDKNRIWTPNVEAKEFVPTSRCSSTVSEYTPYDTFDLENLLTYTVDLMDGDKLRSYAFALRNKVWEKMAEFNRYQDELEILCELTDGDQTEKNQKIISTRMCFIVRRSLQYMTSPNFGRSYGVNHRRFNHGNHNNYSGRKFHSSSSRERAYRQ